LHLSVNNRDTSTSILSLKEIIGIVFVFSMVLYLLFPKDNIEQIIETKGKNTNLSINYLESMLLFYPDNKKLKMILIKNYDYAGEIQKALSLANELILETEDKKTLGELYKTQYSLMKEIYFQTNDKELLPKIREKLYDCFGYSTDDIDYMFFFAESSQMDFLDLKYISIIGLMEDQPELIDYGFEKEAFYIASNLGYKREAHSHLLKLLEYDDITKQLKTYALNSLIEFKEFEKATLLATSLLLESRDQDEIVSFFNLALYAINQNKDSTKEEVRNLIALYQGSRDLKAHDIQLILSSLLQIGDVTGAGESALALFQTHPQYFDKKNIELAIKSLIYCQELAPALEISNFAYNKFHESKWLDQSIKLSQWLGQMQDAVDLNIKGYRTYKDKKYEKYLLKSTTLDSAYSILGEIYKNQLERGNHSMITKVAEYYDYIGDVPNGERYFLDIFKKDRDQEVHKQAILFSYKNSHFEQGLELYRQYKKKYGMDKSLQKLSIKKLLALKKVKQAYLFTKELESKERYNKKLQALLKNLDLHNDFRLYTKLIDMGWIEKDYQYLYNILWKREDQQELQYNNYTKLVQLEKALNNSKRLAYLYQKTWENTSRKSYLFSLLYLYIKNKEFKKLESLVKGLKPKDKKELERNVHYQILMAKYYFKTDQIQKSTIAFEKALKLDSKSAKTHETYLWFLMDHRMYQALKKEIILLRKNPKLQKEVGFTAVIGALILQQEDVALRWLKPLLKKDNNPEYRDVYNDIMRLRESKEWDMVNSYSPDTEISTQYKHLTPYLSFIENQISYRWRLYKGIESKLSLNHYNYTREKRSNIEDNQLSLSLQNSDSDLLWEFTLAEHLAEDNFISSSLSLQYRVDETYFNILSEYQVKTEQTPKLQAQGVENSIAFDLKSSINHRVQLGLSYKISEYKSQSMEKVGNSSHLNINSNYLLRSGYPDIRLNTYLSHNEYESENKNLPLPQNFLEFGSQLSIGTSSQHNIKRGWRPFGVLGIAVNDQKDIGTSLSMGISGALKGMDSLSLMLDYSKGMDTISYPYYGFHLDYRF